ncbi:hypothetical protein N9L68_04880 [bacterium]|nr:hypothetical protein [bacterium]
MRIYLVFTDIDGVRKWFFFGQNSRSVRPAEPNPDAPSTGTPPYMWVGMLLLVLGRRPPRRCREVRVNRRLQGWAQDIWGIGPEFAEQCVEARGSCLPCLDGCPQRRDRRLDIIDKVLLGLAVCDPIECLKDVSGRALLARRQEGVRRLLRLNGRGSPFVREVGDPDLDRVVTVLVDHGGLDLFVGHPFDRGVGYSANDPSSSRGKCASAAAPWYVAVWAWLQCLSSRQRYRWV